MAILNWLKEVPLSAVYKERLVESEKQISALEKKVADFKAENSSLKAQLEHSEDQRRTLEEQVSEKRKQELEEERNFVRSYEPPPMGY
jgi:septal ring factor EnvC (AmiA/AmiB activator)